MSTVPTSSPTPRTSSSSWEARAKARRNAMCLLAGMMTGLVLAIAFPLVLLSNTHTQARAQALHALWAQESKPAADAMLTCLKTHGRSAGAMAGLSLLQDIERCEASLTAMTHLEPDLAAISLLQLKGAIGANTATEPPALAFTKDDVARLRARRQAVFSNAALPQPLDWQIFTAP